MYILLSILNLAIIKNIFMQLGLTIGSILCFIKYILWVKLLYFIITSNNARRMKHVRLIILQFSLFMLFLMLLMFVLHRFSIYLFIGVTAGILISPVVAFIIFIKNAYFKEDFFYEDN
jgi:hypothetical protein